MNRAATRTLALLAAALFLGVACAADPGDPLKTAAAGAASSGGSSGSDASVDAGSGSSGFSVSGSGTASGSSAGASTGTGSDAAMSASGSGSNASDASVDTSTGPSCTTSSKYAAISYETQDNANSTAVNTVSFNLQIINAGGGIGMDFNLSDLTVRYWFTADGNAVSSIYFISYYSSNANMMSQDITKDVMGAFMPAPAANVTSKSDSYLEISFTAAAGALPQLGQPATVQVAFHGPGSNGYSDMFNETNDYSFDPAKTPNSCSPSPCYTPWNHITAYVKGALVWGCEPGAGGAGAGGDAGGVADSALDVSGN